MGMFSYTCEKCGEAEQFNHYPLATIKLIEKYSDGVIENIYFKTYYDSYGRFIPLLGELCDCPICNIKEYAFIEKNLLSHVYHWKLPKYFIFNITQLIS